LGLTRLGVVGWPVAHSRSPVMQNAALRAAGLEGWRYQHLPVPPELFAETVRALHGAGFVGANVTIPHKEAALALADEATPAARAIGAANMLYLSDGAIAVDNTDAPGLIAALGDRRPGTALLLGAGGTGRAAAYALSRAGAAVKVWNRTADRARVLAADLDVEAVDAPGSADVLVNCTSVGLADPLTTFKDLPLSADSLGQYACVVDFVYRAGGTPLVQEAQRRGSQTIDGLEILVQQGAVSFEGWTGRAAPLDVMRQAARDDDVSHRDEPARTSPPAPGRAGNGRGGGAGR
jgi:shikimate dehydrogenase